MKLVILSKDENVVEVAKQAFRLDEELVFHSDWSEALDACADADMIFVDLVATLDEPHKIAGYERFAHSKMAHPRAKSVPVALIAPPANYDLDFMVGWPDFVFTHLRKPVNEKVFRRIVTYI